MDFMGILSVFLAASLGTPYHYGGNNFIEGFDCSGFVMEYMKTYGIGPRQDSSAQMIHDYYLRNKSEVLYSYDVDPSQWDPNDVPVVGTLIFFGRSTREITHVAVMINGYQMVEAGGGDRSVLSAQEAAAKNAYVKVRPYKHGQKVQRWVLPRYPVETGFYDLVDVEH